MARDRRRKATLGIVVLALGVGAGGVAYGVSQSTTPASPDDPDDAAPNTVAIGRHDIVRNDEFDGTLGYGTAAPLVLAGSGTLTRLPHPGQLVEPGDAIVDVDGRPVLTALGDVPMWRDLGPGVDDGADVAEVERMLERLGYATDYDVTVDEEWTSATTRAVKAFQADHGQDDDGTISLGELLVVPGTVRVETVGGVPGMAVAEAAIEATGAEQLVQIDVAVDQVGRFTIGDALTIELPDDSTVTGTVAAIEPAATAGDGGTTVPVDLTVDEMIDLPDGTPVTVLVGVVSAKGVLAVPVEAIVALAEGGFAVEVADGATTHYVRVTLGAFADGMVEIDGDVAEGQNVVVP